jgi:predicted dithiol-disulfide oxidoreductase (DUF899 family)
MTSQHNVVSPAAFLAARQSLLEAERQLTKQREAVAQQRRALPWVRVDKPYHFESSAGALRLDELFQGKRQLLVYHLMFAPEWEAACKSCTFWADSFDGMVPHLQARDVGFAAISRAPVSKLQAYAHRLGWKFRWVSSGDSSFNYDYGVSFTPEQLDRHSDGYNYGVSPAQGSDMPGFSVFCRDDAGAVFHTYSTYSRGIELLNPVYAALDLVPKGRDEAGLPFPMSWVRRRDEY